MESLVVTTSSRVLHERTTCTWLKEVAIIGRSQRLSETFFARIPLRRTSALRRNDRWRQSTRATERPISAKRTKSLSTYLSWLRSLGVAHNKQLQRTVTRRR